MARIAVTREEPYLDLRSMSRHHKSKQALTLKALSKASFINGSSFLVAWVSPQGTFSVFASEYLQAGVDRMFTPELRLECVQMAKKGREVREKELREGKGERGESMDGLKEEDDEDADGSEEEDEDEEEEAEVELSALGAAVAAVGDAGGARKGRVNTRAQLANASSSSVNNSSLPTPAATASSSTSSPAVYTTPTPITTTSSSSRTIDPAVTEYLLDRLNALGRPTSKTVAKSWSAATKQTYRDGSTPPSFWPAGVMYLNPQDLTEDDRSLFLLALLREPSVPIQRLELATASVGALISANKAPVLRQIYKVARMEEAGLPIDLSKIVESPSVVVAAPVEVAPAPPIVSSSSTNPDHVRKSSSGFGEGNLAWLFQGDMNGIGLEDRRGKMAVKRPSVPKKNAGLSVDSDGGSVASSKSRKRTASATTLEGSQQEKKTKAKPKTQKDMVVDQENVSSAKENSSTSSRVHPQPDRQPFGQSNHPHQVYEYRQQHESSVSPYLQPPHHFQPSPYYPNNTQLHPSSCHFDASPNPQSSSSCSSVTNSPYPSSQYGAPPPHQYPSQFSPYPQSPYPTSLLDPYAAPPTQPLRQEEFYPPPPGSHSNDQLSSLPIQRTHSAPPTSSNPNQYLPRPQPPRIARRPSSRVQQLAASPLYDHGAAPPGMARGQSFDSANANPYYHSHTPPLHPQPPATPVLEQSAFAWQEEYSGFSMPGGGFGLGIRMGGDGLERTMSPMNGQEQGRFGDEFVERGRG